MKKTKYITAPERTAGRLSKLKSHKLEYLSRLARLDTAVMRLFTAVLVAFTVATLSFGQTIESEISKKNTRQSSETIMSTLREAEKTAKYVEVTIETAAPLTAEALESFSVNGQIRAVYIASATNDWKGAVYSTPSEPIKSLAEGLRRYEKLYRDGDKARTDSLFVMTAFTIYGAAADALQAGGAIPNAALVSVSTMQNRTPKKLPQTGSLNPQADITDNSSESMALSAASATAPAFVPNNAKLDIQTLSNSDRQINVSFSWNTAADLAGLSTDRSAFEVQVLFWNHAANPGSNNISYVGNIKAWGSNGLSHGYFDTAALNASGIGGSTTEREVTIGTFDARSDLQAGRQYSVWAVTERGALDANFAKLSFQRGIYKPTLLQNAAVNAYCAIMGDSNPANCVGGEDTQIVTPQNYTGTSFSILAPTAPSFTYLNQICAIPPGYPANIGRPSSLDETAARSLAPRILSFQKVFAQNGSQFGPGCPTNFAHQDGSWWPSGGWTQDVNSSQHGNGALLLASGANQAFWIHGGIWTLYSQIGGPKSVAGEPTGNEQAITSSTGNRGAYQSFKNGWLYYNGGKNQTYYVVNAIAQKYQSAGLHAGQLGFPTSSEYVWNGGARNDFERGYIYWTSSTGAVVVLNQQTAAPTVSRFTADTTPVAGKAFGGTVTGTGFIAGGTQVWFCVSGSSTCYQHPSAGVAVTNTTTLRVTNVSLSAGSWQVYVRTSAGASGRTTSFTVQLPAPTISGYTWNSTPYGGQSFGGTIRGADFVSGATQIFFCVNGTSTCYQQPAAGVNASSSTSVIVSGVRLSSGAWQIYAKTASGTSARSAAFTVR
jgi:hypothetical protein